MKSIFLILKLNILVLLYLQRYVGNWLALFLNLLAFKTINDTCRFFVQTLKHRLEELNFYFETTLSLSESQTDPISKVKYII
jgi:hypothetical protein